MACGATLKRSLDFDPLHTAVSTSSSHVSPMIIPRTPPNKRRRLSSRCGSVYTSNDCRVSSGLSPLSRSNIPSPFQPSSPVSSESILKNIYDEYKRMKRRRQLQMNQTVETDTQHQANAIQNLHTASPSMFLPSPVQAASSSSYNILPEKKLLETPMLTMKQVGMICERLLKEQEEKIRSEYEKVLVAKLSEQYDAFVKFNHDQLQRRMSEHPASYVS